MNLIGDKRRAFIRSSVLRFPVLALWTGATLWLAGPAQGLEIDGFTEPNRTIEVAAVETGTIKTVEVREGQIVGKGQVLARLDDDVYNALLAIAEKAMTAEGQRNSVEAELTLRRQRLAKLKLLRDQGHARQEEVDRARADVEISEGRVQAANESLQVKKLEYEKTRVQIARRVVRAPIDGVVNVLRKDQGEFVAPNDPYILELVELDPLLAVFSVPSYEAVKLKIGQTVPVFLEDAGKFVQGSVHFVAPVTDAESGTARVKIRIANEQRMYRSGERCTLQLEQPARRSRQKSSRASTRHPNTPRSRSGS